MTFEEWLDEFEGFSTRRERFMHSFEDAIQALIWLRAAYNIGLEEGYKAASRVDQL